MRRAQAFLAQARPSLWHYLGGQKEGGPLLFLMVLIPIIGANAKDILDGGLASSSVSTISLLVGFFAAFISGVLACQWMIAIVTRGKLIHFAYYCGIVGLAPSQPTSYSSNHFICFWLCDSLKQFEPSAPPSQGARPT